MDKPVEEAKLSILLDLPEFIRSRIMPEPNTGCWLWSGNLSYGYAIFKIGGRKGKWIRMHRLLFELKTGLRPETLDHLCLQKSCVNPDHLQILSRGENVQRHFRRQTHCKNGHPLIPENLVSSALRRTCKICRNQWWQAYHRKKKASG